MKDFKSITKYILLGFLWAIIGSLLAFGIKSFTSYTLKDSLFLEGLILVTMAVLSSVSGPSSGGAFRSVSHSNPEYVMSGNIQVTEKESGLINIRSNIKMIFNTIVVALGGIFCIIMNFMI